MSSERITKLDHRFRGNDATFSRLRVLDNEAPLENPRREGDFLAPTILEGGLVVKNGIALGNGDQSIINANSNYVRNLLDPVQDQDAATKAYVDSHSGDVLVQENLANNSLSVGSQVGDVDSVAFSTFVGVNAAPSVSGIGNTIMGYDSGENLTLGSNNTLIGQSAGNSLISGSENVHIGMGAGLSVGNSTTGTVIIGSKAGQNNIGDDCIIIGRNAGRNNHRDDNVFIGTRAGRNNTTGLNNVFIGSSTGESNTTGNVNVFVGSSCGRDNTTGIGNVLYGYLVGDSITTGSFNTIIGGVCGGQIKTGSANTITGYGAGSSCSGQFNTIYGFMSGGSVNGMYNTIVGTTSGNRIQSGNKNVIIGNGCANNGDDTTGTVIIGSNTGKVNEADNIVMIGRESGSDNTTGAFNTFIGTASGSTNTTGSRNTFVGYNAGIVNVTGDNNVCIGANSDVSSATGFNQIAIGKNAVCINNNSVQFGDSSLSPEEGTMNMYDSVVFDMNWSSSSSAGLITNDENGNNVKGGAVELITSNEATIGDNTMFAILSGSANNIIMPTGTFTGKSVLLVNTTSSDITIIGPATDISPNSSQFYVYDGSAWVP